MLTTIRHNDTGKLVVAAKLLTGYVVVKSKVEDPVSFVKVHQTYDAEFVAHVVTWQKIHGLTADGIIGPKTWAKIASLAPTCSTAKKRISAYTLALQMIVDSSITADAIYGNRTKNAVAAYQSAKGLKADGICGPVTWKALITGEVEAAPGAAGGAGKPVAGKYVKPTDFKQGDSRWGKKMYSSTGNKSQTMANSACGPTSMADIIHFCNDKSINPYDMAKLAMKWGDRTPAKGTAWTFFTHIQAHYGYKKMVATKSLETLKACLDAGGYVVCSMGPGYWTKGGHFICAWKYDGTYIYCNDPASSSRKKQKIADFVSQRKQFFCFFPNAA